MDKCDGFREGILREALIKDTTFDEAVKRLSETPIIAPIFYIVAGADNSMDGAIITRNQTAVNGPVTDGVEYTKPLLLKDSPHEWYLVETNYDYWHIAKDARRAAAIRMMDEMGQENVSFDNLFEILSTPPVLENTVFTSLYSPTDGDYFNITIRYDTD